MPKHDINFQVNFLHCTQKCYVWNNRCDWVGTSGGIWEYRVVMDKAIIYSCGERQGKNLSSYISV